MEKANIKLRGRNKKWAFRLVAGNLPSKDEYLLLSLKILIIIAKISS